jgi:uroporphyrinogen decarboxylase
MTNLFQKTLRKENKSRPPVWLMRQAGRYHAHYQKLKERHTFLDLCKKPELACETTLGPIDDFGFDAAILFSDLLFPLEAMGMGLTYEVGPKLDWHLRKKEDIQRFKSGAQLVEELQFQADALQLIRKVLPQEKGLLGFVGGPLTLYGYAVEGTHKGEMESARQGFSDGRYQGFFEKLEDVLVENMVLQATSGADTVLMIDTCAGEFDVNTYREWAVPAIHSVLKKFKKRLPEYPILYYSKGTSAEYWAHLVDLPIAGMGVDWRTPIADVLNQWSDRWLIQGNVDPEWLFLDSAELEKRLRVVFESVKKLPAEKRRGWVCGLGHGILPKTPEQNVRLFLKLQKEIFPEG